MKEKINYTDAFEELQIIVAEMEKGEITVDQLSEKEGVRIVSFSISDAAVKTTNNGQDVLQAGKRLEVSMMIYMTRGSSDGK